ncbi:MAG: GatB/YqeY domain-containing protein [Coriobacteriia bacterium]|nr:GatB/YqeY domain-containing protein [Coriobacteriia bacterium]MBN2839858.1 GatB/YqeY domain-containing protein [Coriobacteriia bacterium]
MDKALIVSEITSALRAHDKVRLSILRQVKNEIDIKEKDAKREVTSEEVVALLKKVLKQTGETLEGSMKVGTDDARTALLTEQVAILEELLPAQVTGDALAGVVERVLAAEGITEKREMGRAIGLISAECGGNCDKAEVARIVGGRLG